MRAFVCSARPHRTAILATAIVTLLASSARANGIPAYMDRTGWHLMAEESQQAVIALRDGRETMLLGVHVAADATPEQASRLVWLTPVPAPPNEVQVAILRDFPLISGYEPAGKLASDLRGALWAMSATQIYPIIPAALFVVALRGEGVDGPPVVVLQHLRRHGVELELLTAPSREALSRHLERQEIRLPEAAMRSLRPYYGQRACLVLFRVADLAAYRAAAEGGGQTLGVQIRFPTREGFYPLVASSALPGTRLEVVVTALGHMVPAGDPPEGLMVEHYVGTVSADHETLRVLGVDPAQPHDLPYTRLHLVGAPTSLTRDLRFRPGGTTLAASWVASRHYGRNLLALAATVFIGLCIISCLLARGVWRSEEHTPSRGVTVALALANLLTVLAVLLAALIIARRHKVPARRAVLFTLAQSLLLCLLLVGLGLLTRLI